MKTKLFFNLILFVVLFVPSLVAAQTNEFTYQGRLTDGSMPANASYDFEFRLYDAAAGGNHHRSAEHLAGRVDFVPPRST